MVVVVVDLGLGCWWGGVGSPQHENRRYTYCSTEGGGGGGGGVVVVAAVVVVMTVAVGVGW